MVIQLLQPIWLWGLLSLLIPTAIHLLHKRSRRVVMVGSLQPFRGGTPVQASSLRLNEVWLLLLRCLLLALFVLLLAEPVVPQGDSGEKKHLFIAPELSEKVNRDSLQAAGFALRLLQPGLPAFSANARPDTTLFSYWDVFREIEKLEQAGDTVWLQFTPTLDRFWGRRPALSKTFQLLNTPQKPKEKHLARVVQLPRQQLLVQWWDTGQAGWGLHSDTLAVADTATLHREFSTVLNIQPIDTLQVVFQADATGQAESKGWQLALQLIDSLLPHQAIVFTERAAASPQLPKTTDVWIWQAEQTPPAAFLQKSTLIRILHKPGKGRQWFVQDRQDARLYAMQHSLQKQGHKRERLALFIPQMQEILLAASDEIKLPPVIMADNQWQVRKGARQKAAIKEVKAPLAPFFWIALLLIFILERWLSLQK
ncbi:MAG: BatA domain-containing protein [Bacteroidetes bacterium]|nr:BatA domain-containing protein [Bacteroidota bacterium]